MVLETVKATYDPDTKAIYVWLGNKRIDKSEDDIVRTISSLDGEIHYDLDKNGEIVGVEVILS